MLLAAYALVALVSTSLASPTPSYDLKQISRAEVVRRIKRGVRARAPVPSGAGGAPDQVNPSSSGAPYSKFFTGSAVLLSANPSGESPNFPSIYTTFSNTISTASAAQQCIDFANDNPGGSYFGAALWFDESDNLWHCRATFNQNQASDFTAADANANPVYGYNSQSGG